MLAQSKLEFVLGFPARCSTLGRIFRTAGKHSVTHEIDCQIRRFTQHYGAMMSRAKDSLVRRLCNRGNLKVWNARRVVGWPLDRRRGQEASHLDVC